jgi:putative transposase
MELDIPRDRQGEFEPELIKKYDKDISQIEDRILTFGASKL